MYSDNYHFDLSGKTIAVIDDDLASIRYFEVLLKTTSADVVTFSTGTDFLNYIKDNPNAFDMILIDYLIPFVNGIDCIRALRKSDKKTPVLMITAYYTRESKEEAYIAGCNEYILKPVVPEKILGVLHKYLVQKEFVYLDKQ